MVKFQLIVIISMLLSVGVFAQNKSKKVKVHNIWIELTDNSKIYGVLYSADINGIKITSGISIDDSSLLNIAPQNIYKIKIRRKGKVGRGALYGASIGLITGVAMGLGDDGNYEPYTFGFGFMLSILGTGAGALIYAKKKRFKIIGNVEAYNNHLLEIQRYSYTGKDLN